MIFSAPSGAGKTTITRFILENISGSEFSVSATTRGKRAYEIDGKDYFFLSEENFQAKITNDEFIEWEEVYKGNFYGTLKSEIERIWGDGKVVLFDVDVKGGLRLKRFFGDKALAIFIMPPSIQELQKRLEARKTETHESLLARVGKAFSEIDYYKNFDILIINDSLTKAREDAKKVIEQFLNS